MERTHIGDGKQKIKEGGKKSKDTFVKSSTVLLPVGKGVCVKLHKE